ncbi:MAG TPA: EVE domain-containing protein [Thermomicrobiales bacterium]|jgi:predicted RNA-binding protein|nr:EVE domain-containing protein [Chloroflexota bacterium]HBY46979.1 EVE domain-containing protein [Chloroflexota bacterium]HCG29029.1 EVE domain-containing protein [Chloroflexota bacterium]HQZ89617.1 EVE domain-containing protein [Thermomicrobiales bacterium]HRA32071.1 EVE domain-containing protein [Thermomicrobiales bacterium]
MSTHTNWIVVGSPDNFEATRALGFSVQGLKSRHRKKAETMKPGDRIIWYITGLKAFAGYATVTSEYFEDHTLIWKSKDPKRDAEDYPWRFHIEPVVVLDKQEFVEAEPIARQMAHVAKWPEANWTLAFQGNIHKIGDDDFEIIRLALDHAATAVAN